MAESKSRKAAFEKYLRDNNGDDLNWNLRSTIRADFNAGWDARKEPDRVLQRQVARLTAELNALTAVSPAGSANDPSSPTATLLVERPVAVRALPPEGASRSLADLFRQRARIYRDPRFPGVHAYTSKPTGRYTVRFDGVCLGFLSPEGVAGIPTSGSHPASSQARLVRMMRSAWT